MPKKNGDEPLGFDLINHYAIINTELAMRHRRLEERSLALHREIGRRLRRDPGLLTTIRDRLTKGIHGTQFSASVTDAIQEWLDLLKTSSLKEILELLVDQCENARRLRQSTPFAEIPAQEERRRILEKHESAGV